MTVDGFYQRREDADLADPERPVWIVNEAPLNSTSALTNTWTIGPLPAGGDSAPSSWKVTRVRAGTYSLRYRVARGHRRQGQGRVVRRQRPATGSFTVRISRAPHSLEQQS